MDYSHVLISRPGPEAAKLAETIEGTGLIALCMPVFRFEPGFPGIDFSKAWQPGERRLVIFSSTRAVEFGLRQLPAGYLDGVEIAAIGPATANALESAGHTVSIVPDTGFNSEALLEHPALVSNPGKALIFAAPGGRLTLFSRLQKLGWAVEFAHVYRAVPLEPAVKAVEEILQSRKVLSVWTSANALEHLMDSLDPAARERVFRGDFVVTSARLGEIARGFTAGQIHVTDGPGNKAIRECILQLI
jgi:uroporphyrinogen-III synthase